MSTARPPRKRLGLLAAATVLLFAGCGQDASTPAEEVPDLSETLSRVDDALSDRRFAKARAHLNDLVETTVEAREAGDLEPEQADQVLAAAARLLSALPAPRAADEREPAPEPEVEPLPTEEPPEDDEEWEKQQEELEKKREELEKKLEEERKKLEEERKKLKEEQSKDEEGGGNGDSSENGPDDGEGN